MKKQKKRWILCAAAFTAALVLSGCAVTENQKTFSQAGRDLAQGSYAYALDGYLECIETQTSPALSYRGAGICRLRMGKYAKAVKDFTAVLKMENLSGQLKKDVLSYRATAFLALNKYEEALNDCRALQEMSRLDADGYFLMGKASLALDAYQDAFSSFDQSYRKDSSYERAIQIYEAYLAHDMEADGTYFLELSLLSAAKTAKDYCSRGKVYYYMADYDSARSELIEALKMGSVEAELLLAMTYLAKDDVANAKAMYTQYITLGDNPASGYNGLAICDMRQKHYDEALEKIQAGIPLATTAELSGLLYNEIVVYERKLDFETAYSKAREYLELFPEDTQAQREYVFLKSRVTTD